MYCKFAGEKKILLEILYNSLLAVVILNSLIPFLPTFLGDFLEIFMIFNVLYIITPHILFNIYGVPKGVSINTKWVSLLVFLLAIPGYYFVNYNFLAEIFGLYIAILFILPLPLSIYWKYRSKNINDELKKFEKIFKDIPEQHPAKIWYIPLNNYLDIYAYCFTVSLLGALFLLFIAIISKFSKIFSLIAIAIFCRNIAYIRNSASKEEDLEENLFLLSTLMRLSTKEFAALLCTIFGFTLSCFYNLGFLTALYIQRNNILSSSALPDILAYLLLLSFYSPFVYQLMYWYSFLKLASHYNRNNKKVINSYSLPQYGVYGYILSCVFPMVEVFGIIFCFNPNLNTVTNFQIGKIVVILMFVQGLLFCFLILYSLFKNKKLYVFKDIDKEFRIILFSTVLNSLILVPILYLTSEKHLCVFPFLLCLLFIAVFYADSWRNFCALNYGKCIKSQVASYLPAIFAFFLLCTISYIYFKEILNIFIILSFIAIISILCSIYLNQNVIIISYIIKIKNIIFYRYQILFKYVASKLYSKYH